MAPGDRVAPLDSKTGVKIINTFRRNTKKKSRAHAQGND